MTKITVQLKKESILKLIYLEIKNSSVIETTLLDSFKDNKELMNLLVNNRSSDMSFLENCLRHGQYEWVKELFKREDVKVLLKNEIKNTNIVDNKVKLKTPSIINYLLEVYGGKIISSYYKENLDKTNTILTQELIQILRSDVESQKEYKKVFNTLMKDDDNPIIFTILPMFKNNTDLIENFDLINWYGCDKEGNTIFHNLLNYDEYFYPIIIKKMNELNANEIKNKINQNPLDKWLKELVFSNKNNSNLISLKELNKLNSLFKAKMIGWENKDMDLFAVIKKLFLTHARTYNIEELKLIENIFTYVVKIPEIKNSKIQGYLNGIFNFSKKEGEQLIKVSSIQRIFMQDSLEKNLNKSNTIIKKIKL